MEWYYASGSQRKGPVTQETLANLAVGGEVTDSTLVWNESMAEWEPFSLHRAAVSPGIPPALPAGTPLFCMNCGRATAANELVPVGGRRVCASCKQVVLQQMREGAIGVTSHRFAGFWIRFGAVMIDTVVVGVVSGVFGAVMGLMGLADPTSATFLIVQLVSVLGAVLYEILMIAAYGATVGKKVLGLKVIRANGGDLGGGLSTGRYFAKFISGVILLIGYIMAAWDGEKRALHDRICDTRVIRVR